MDIKEQGLIKSDLSEHWYYRAKLAALARMISTPPTSILDVGAGSGFFSAALLRSTAARSAI